MSAMLYSRTGVTLVFLLASVVVAHAAEPSLRVSLTSNRSTVTMADAITLSVKVENVSDTPMWIFGDLRWGEAGALTLNVGPWADDGALPLFIDEWRFTREEVTSEALIRLNPHVFLGTERTINVHDLVRRPGKYHLWIEYSGPIPAAEFEKPFWSSERGSVISPAIVLEVNGGKKRQSPKNH